MKTITTKAVIIGKASLVLHYENQKFTVRTPDGVYTYNATEMSKIYNLGPKDILELESRMFDIQDNVNLVQ